MPSSYIFRKLLTIFILQFYWQILIAFSRWLSGFKAVIGRLELRRPFLSNFLISCCALSDFTYQIIAYFLAPLNLYHAAIVLNCLTPSDGTLLAPYIDFTLVPVAI